MKILTIAATPYFSDRGCHIRVFLEAKYLQKNGADIFLCTYHLGKNIGDFEIERIGNIPWYKKTSPGFAWGKVWLDLKLLLLCTKEIKRLKPDVIHAHLFEGLAIGYLAKIITWKRNIPILVDLQGELKSEMENYNKRNRLATSFFVGLSKKLINLADFVVVSSENAYDSYKKIFKSHGKIKVVKDGVDLDLFKDIKTSGEVWFSEVSSLKKWAEKNESRVLIYTGGMEDSKGVPRLLDGFIKIKKEGEKRWKLLLFGNGSDRKRYQKMVDDAGLSGEIKFTENTSFFALPTFLKMADVAVDPKRSSTESSGKLMNYMAAKLPVICFDNDFNRNRLGDNGNYLLGISDLKAVLENTKIGKVKYDLGKDSQECEGKKIFEIFVKLLSNENK